MEFFIVYLLKRIALKLHLFYNGKDTPMESVEKCGLSF